jgi:hypothetical protein
VVNTTEIDSLHDSRVGLAEGCHGLEVAGEHQPALAVGLPVGHSRGGIGHRHKTNLDIGGYRHPIKLLLPVAGGDLVVHQDDQIDSHRPAPADHHLAVDQPVVHPAQHNRHQGIRIDFSPAAAA